MKRTLYFRAWLFLPKKNVKIIKKKKKKKKKNEMDRFSDWKSLTIFTRTLY